MSSSIPSAVVEYYKLEINDKMPTVIAPYDDPDLVCCVMDRIRSGSFNRNVVYGRGPYFISNLDVFIEALRKSTVFKEVPSKDGKHPGFRYVGKR